MGRPSRNTAIIAERIGTRNLGVVVIGRWLLWGRVVIIGNGLGNVERAHHVLTHVLCVGIDLFWHTAADLYEHAGRKVGCELRHNRLKSSLIAEGCETGGHPRDRGQVLAQDFAFPGAGEVGDWDVRDVPGKFHVGELLPRQDSGGRNSLGSLDDGNLIADGNLKLEKPDVVDTKLLVLAR